MRGGGEEDRDWMDRLGEGKVMAIFSRRLVGKTVTRQTALPPPATSVYIYIGSSREKLGQIYPLTTAMMTAMAVAVVFFSFLGPRVHTGCCCCSWFTSLLPTRRHFNATQSPFNKPINELCCCCCPDAARREDDTINEIRESVTEKGDARTSLRRTRTTDGRGRGGKGKGGELMRNLCFRDSVKGLQYGGTP